jgi:hypothetical protein
MSAVGQKLTPQFHQCDVRVVPEADKSGACPHMKVSEMRLLAEASPNEVMMVSGSMTVVPAVTVHILAMVTVPSAMGASVPRSSKSLHGKQNGGCDNKNQQ